MLDRLEELGYMHVINFNKTDQTLSYNGSFIWFSSTDTAEKRKSEEWNLVWMEEATEFNLGDYKEIVRRCRHERIEGLKNQVYLTLNPEDENSWIRKETKEDYCTSIHSTIDDNPFAHPEDIEKLDREKDEVEKNIYRYGKWGSRRGIIFTNWDYAESWPEGGELVRGLDFGFNNKMAVVDIKKIDNDIYLRETVYESNMTNADLIARLNVLYPDKQVEIYADPSSKSEIEDIYRSGFNIKPAENDVLAGLMHVKQFNIHMLKGHCANIESERLGYRWKVDKNENALDQPTKENDHLMDAIRYGIFTAFKTIPRQPRITLLRKTA